MVTTAAGKSLSSLAHYLNQNNVDLTQLALLASQNNGRVIHRETNNFCVDLQALQAASVQNTTVTSLKVSVTGRHYYAYLTVVEACVSLGRLRNLNLVLYGPTAICDVLYLITRLIPHVTSTQFRRLSIEFKYRTTTTTTTQQQEQNQTTTKTTARETAEGTSSSTTTTPYRSRQSAFTKPQQIQQQPMSPPPNTLMKPPPPVPNNGADNNNTTNHSDMSTEMPPTMTMATTNTTLSSKRSGGKNTEAAASTSFPGAPPLMFREVDMVRALRILLDRVPQMAEFVLLGRYDGDPLHKNSRYTHNFAVRLLKELLIELHEQKLRRNALGVSSSSSSSSSQSQQKHRQPPNSPIVTHRHYDGGDNHNNINNGAPSTPTPLNTNTHPSRDVSGLRTVYIDLTTNHLTSKIHWEKNNSLLMTVPQFPEAWDTFCRALQYIEPYHVKFTTTTTLTPEQANARKADELVVDDDFAGELALAMDYWFEELSNETALTNLTTVEFKGSFSSSMTTLLNALGGLPTLQTAWIESRPTAYRLNAHKVEQFRLEKFPRDKLLLQCNAFRSSYWTILQNMILDNRPSEIHLFLEPYTSHSSSRSSWTSTPFTPRKPTTANPPPEMVPQQQNSFLQNRYNPWTAPLPTMAQRVTLPEPFQVMATSDAATATATPNSGTTISAGGSPTPDPPHFMEEIGPPIANDDLDRALYQMLGQVPFLSALQANIVPSSLLPRLLHPFCTSQNLRQVALSGKALEILETQSPKTLHPQVLPSSSSSSSSSSSWMSNCRKLPVLALRQVMACDNLLNLSLSHFYFTDEQDEDGEPIVSSRGDSNEEKTNRIESLWCNHFVDCSISNLRLEHCILTQAHARGLVESTRGKENYNSLGLFNVYVEDTVLSPPLANGRMPGGGPPLVTPLSPPTALLSGAFVHDMIAYCQIENFSCNNAASKFLGGLEYNESIRRLVIRFDPDFFCSPEETDRDGGGPFNLWNNLVDVIRENDTLECLTLEGVKNAKSPLEIDTMNKLYDSVCSNYRLRDINLSEIGQIGFPEQDQQALNRIWRKCLIIWGLNKMGRRYLKAVKSDDKMERFNYNPRKARAQGVQLLANVASMELDLIFTVLSEDPDLCDVHDTYSDDGASRGDDDGGGGGGDEQQQQQQMNVAADSENNASTSTNHIVNNDDDDVDDDDDSNKNNDCGANDTPNSTIGKKRRSLGESTLPWKRCLIANPDGN